MVRKPLFQLLKYAASEGIFKLDVVGYADIMTAADLLEQEPAYANQYTNHLKMGGYKVFLDGSPQGRTAWMTSRMRENQQQLLVHCNGDAAAEQYIAQFEKVLSEKDEAVRFHR